MVRAEPCPDFSRWEFLDCAVTNFAVMVANWLDSFKIVFVRRATEVLLAYVAVARFNGARVWSYLISVKCAALACVACTFAA